MSEAVQQQIDVGSEAPGRPSAFSILVVLQERPEVLIGLD